MVPNAPNGNAAEWPFILLERQGAMQWRLRRMGRRLGLASGIVGAIILAACESAEVASPTALPPPFPPSGPFACGDASTACEIGAGSAGPFLPELGPATTAAVAPPAISGGTLLALSEGGTAVASDPDRDLVYVVDLASASVTFTIELQSGDEPGRLVEDGAGRVHVALRRGGALVTLDPSTGTLLGRRDVCPAPRGVAWDSSADAIWVACATGELVALPSSPVAEDAGAAPSAGGAGASHGGNAAESFVLQRDLRDVVVEGDGSLAVSLFRSAQILRVGRDGTVLRTDAMPALAPALPHVAWRTVAAPQGATVTVHQEQTTASLQTHVPGGYGSSAGASATTSVASVLDANGTAMTSVVLPAVLPVDVALSPDANTVVVAAAGDAYSSLLPDVIILRLDGSSVLGGVFDAPSTALMSAFSPPVNPPPEVKANGAFLSSVDAGFSQVGTIQQAAVAKLPGDSGKQAVAVAFDPAKEILVQTREPATLEILDPTYSTWRTVALSSLSRADTGHALFHSAAGALIACASCHPEGGDDGHVWTLDNESRRTPSLRGTIAGTAPYHWPGDEADIPALLQDVYTHRMSGPSLSSDSMSRIESWVEAIPAPPAPSWVDPAAAGRGQALFASTTTGCGACHAGAKLTNNATVDVGTGGAFQVPPLVGVGWRTPLMHDGCAATVADRFAPACATAAHGTVGALTADQITDLTAYLDTL